MHYADVLAGSRHLHASFGWHFWGDDYAEPEFFHEIIIRTDKGNYQTVRQDRLYKFKKGEVVKLVERWGKKQIIPFKK